MPLPLARLALAGLVVFGAALSGCRGTTSSRPPIHPNLNMDFQEKFGPQEANPLFADGAAQRPVVLGTVRRGDLRTSESAPYKFGRTADGAFIRTIPVDVTPALLERGKERYEIYCSMCHGHAGDGRGIIMVGNDGQGYGYTPAPTYHSDYLRGVEEGYLYDVILNGVRSMPSYGHQIAPMDRWAIVAYIRALQRSQSAEPGDVPAAERERLRTYNPNVTISN
ncbi:MAG: c-type cytochrome [Rubricoccaceae bacterium]